MQKTRTPTSFSLEKLNVNRRAYHANKSAEPFQYHQYRPAQTWSGQPASAEDWSRLLFRRVGDAFLKLSNAGRAAIAQRNEKISMALRTAVNAARRDVRPESQAIGQRLNDVTERIKAIAASSKKAVLADILRELHHDSRVKALPEVSEKALDRALKQIADKFPMSDWKSRMDVIKSNFLQPRPDGYNMEEGMRLFKDNLISEFLLPEQLAKVSDSGIHEAFVLDTSRRNIKSMGGEVVPHIRAEGDENAPLGSLTNREVNAHCERKLRELVGEDHDDLLPFISMMTSQAGLDSASIFLPHMSGLSERADAQLVNAGIVPSKNTHAITVERQGNDLLINAAFHQGFKYCETVRDPASLTALSYDGHITMRIDLSAPPAEHTVTVTGPDGQQEQRTALIPQFTLENGDVRFTPGERGMAYF